MSFYEWLVGSDFVDNLDKDWPVETKSLFECVVHLKDIHAHVGIYRALVRAWNEYTEVNNVS